MSFYLPSDKFANTDPTILARSPRAIVVINEVQIGCTEIEIHTSAPYVADNFHLEFPLNGQPVGIDFKYWASIEKFIVKIYVGYPKDPLAYNVEDLELVMVAESDNVDVDPFQATVKMSGRDLSSRLIDKKVTRGFTNFTASQLATFFANENRLKPEVVPTSTIIGNYSRNLQTFMAANTTQWDMLVEAAKLENFYVFVENETLIFKPVPSDDGETKPYLLNYIPPSDESASPIFEQGTSLTFYSNNVVSGDLSVTVKVPYNPQNGKAFFVKVKSQNKRGFGGDGTVRKYVQSAPGLTPDQAQKKAQQLWEDLTTHGVRIYATLIPDNNLRKDSLVKVVGTGTNFDQVYLISDITRRISIDDFSMTMSARNKKDGTQIEEELLPQNQPE